MGYKVKEVYVGNTKIRPSGFEYSYDFRNKTESQIYNDGWSVLKGTPVFDSNGFSGSGGTAAISKVIGNTYFANAKKITIQFNGSLNSSSDTAFVICKTATSSSTVGDSGMYASSGGNVWQYKIFGTGTNVSGISSGTYTYKLILDLSNKTYTASVSGKTTQNGALTDTQISNIRNNTQILRVGATNTGSTGVGDISLTIE